MSYPTSYLNDSIGNCPNHDSTCAEIGAFNTLWRGIIFNDLAYNNVAKPASAFFRPVLTAGRIMRNQDEINNVIEDRIRVYPTSQLAANPVNYTNKNDVNKTVVAPDNRNP